jgi:hypothetical protein
MGAPPSDSGTSLATTMKSLYVSVECRFRGGEGLSLTVTVNAASALPTCDLLPSIFILVSLGCWGARFVKWKLSGDGFVRCAGVAHSDLILSHHTEQVLVAFCQLGSLDRQGVSLGVANLDPCVLVLAPPLYIPWRGRTIAQNRSPQMWVTRVRNLC